MLSPCPMYTYKCSKAKSRILSSKRKGKKCLKTKMPCIEVIRESLNISTFTRKHDLHKVEWQRKIDMEVLTKLKLRDEFN